MTLGEPAPSLAEALCRELRQISSDLLHTEKAHFAAARRHQRVHRVLGICATLAGAATAATILSERPTIAAGLALIAALASGVSTFIKPQEAVQRHLDAGRDLGALRVKVRQTLTLDLVDDHGDLREIRQTVARYATEKAIIDRTAPALTDSAYRSGKAKIDRGQFEA